MSYVFYIDAKNKKVIHPDAMKLCPELSVLNEQESLYLILAYDYFSPFNQFPELERSRKSQFTVWGELRSDIVAKEKIKKASECYMSLQFNSKLELIRTYEKKIKTFQDKIDSEDAPSMLKSIMDAISHLKKSIAELQKEATDEIITTAELKGGKKLSWLEEMQRNKEMYNSIRTTKAKTSESVQ